MSQNGRQYRSHPVVLSDTQMKNRKNLKLFSLKIWHSEPKDPDPKLLPWVFSIIYVVKTIPYKLCEIKKIYQHVKIQLRIRKKSCCVISSDRKKEPGDRVH